MSRPSTITREQVETAIAKLTGDNQRPSIAAIRIILGTGSLSTIMALKREIDAGTPKQQAPSKHGLLERVNALLADAREEGRLSREEELSEQRTAIDQLMAENERLENQRLQDESTVVQATANVAQLTRMLADKQRLEEEIRKELSQAEATNRQLQSEIAKLEQEIKTDRQRKATLRTQSAEPAVSPSPSAAEQAPDKALPSTKAHSPRRASPKKAQQQQNQPGV